MWMQQGRNSHLDDFEFSIDFEYTGKDTFKIHFKFELKSNSIFMKEIRNLKAINKQNLNTK